MPLEHASILNYFALLYSFSHKIETKRGLEIKDLLEIPHETSAKSSLLSRLVNTEFRKLNQSPINLESRPIYQILRLLDENQFLVINNLELFLHSQAFFMMYRLRTI